MATSSGRDARAPTTPQLVESCESPPAQAAEIAYEMAYGLSHELNNPLANIAGRARLLAERESDPEKRHQLATIVDQAMRGCEMIADLMLFARPPTWNPGPVDVQALVAEQCARARQSAAAKGLSVSLELEAKPAGSVIQADPQAMAEAVWAILRNALEAAETTITIRISCDESWVKLIIVDDGPGLSPKALSLAFHPYFSGREAGRGLGLGLSKASRIVALCGGSITLGNLSPKGCQATISIPADP